MQTELSIERLRPRGVNKDVSPRAVDIAGNRLVVNPVTDALNRRYLSAENAEVGADSNIPGTIGFDPSLPAGTNLVIGTFTDLEKTKLIFFNYNSNGNHGVYSWDPIAGTFTTLIQKALLNFSNNPRYRITGIGVVQNLLYWTDGLNPQRMINMTRDYSSITDDACINLYKRPPVKGLFFTESILINNDASFGGWLNVLASGLPEIVWTLGGTLSVTTTVFLPESYIARQPNIIAPNTLYEFKMDITTAVSPSNSTLNLVWLDGSNAPILPLVPISGTGTQTFQATSPPGAVRYGFQVKQVAVSAGGAFTIDNVICSSVGYLINDSSFKSSAIANNIYQFATRYLFVDNELSALSMYSEWKSSLSSDTPTKFAFNGFRFNMYIETVLTPIISKVQLLYRRNNSPDWNLYVEKTVTDFSGSDHITVNFFDDNSTTVIPGIEVNKLFDSVPLKSKALTLFKNRTFLTADQEGYEVNQSQSFTVNQVTGTNYRSIKEGASLSVGLNYYDKDLKTPGVKSFIKASVGFKTATADGIDITLRTYFNFKFNDAVVPSWAKYVTFCASNDQIYEKYMQIPVKPMFYVAEGDLKDAAGSAIAIPGTMELYNNGKVYLKVLPDNPSGGTKKFNHIHWQVPESIPFIPDTDCFIRVLTPLSGLDNITAIPVLAFDGQSMVTDNINNLDWSLSGFDKSKFILLEVYKLKKSLPKELFELSNFMADVSDTNLTSATFYYLNNFYNTFVAEGQYLTTIFKFKNLKIDGKPTDPCYDILALVATVTHETPSLILNNTPVPESEQKVVFGGTSALVVDKLGDRTLGRNYDSPNSTPSLVPDYRRVPGSPGRLIAYTPNAKQLIRSTTIRYSETYIQDSNINGLSSFDFQNEYPISTQRTPITKLVGAGDVLLAIHQRATTSMYVGQSQIQDNQGKIQVVATDKVIPNDNELKGRYGSYHPESIQEYRTMVFGFDIFQGVIWKYDNNGQVPVSDQGMKAYFKMKAEQYMIFKDTIAIVGGIDPFNKEYLITFPAIAGASATNLASFPGTGVINTIYKANDTGFVYYWTGSAYAMLLGNTFQGVTSIPAETWAYNWLANGGAGEWTTRYSFIPDSYGYVNNQLISFASGKLWMHNQDVNNCNVFYGVKYDRTITAQLNVAPTKNKNWMAMQISSEELCEGDKYTTKVSAANLGAFPGTGAIGTLYIANDTGKIYRWDGAAYQEIRETYIITCANREVQSTYMKRKEFDKQENIFYGPILKDTNTPSSLLKAGTIALRDGRDMISQVLQVTMTNNSRSLARHHFTNISYVYSAYGF